MVSTRSTRSSTKHSAPNVETEAPAKKQKVTKQAKKGDVEENGKPEETKDEEESKEIVILDIFDQFDP
jgi:hypothetical protein